MAEEISDELNELRIGAGVLRTFRARKQSWLTMSREWIDNSIGFNAKNITFRRTDDILEIIDDGDGCYNLLKMESIAESIFTPDNKASMYGTGGVTAQIYAGDGHLVEVFSTHRNYKSKIGVDWNKCIETGRFKSEYHHKVPSKPGAATGTTIRIHQARRFYKVEEVIKELGHDYGDEIRERGRNITFEVNGEVTKVEAYKPPPLEKKIKFAFKFQGHQITGFCGLVKQGLINNYPGWSIHWGYRVAMVTTAPAGNHAVRRIYGEVWLPETWEDIGPTKDDFISDADEFWAKIGNACADIIKQDDSESTDFELDASSKLVGDMLTGAFAGTQEQVKGSRPGRGGKNGTVESTGTGSEHEDFTTWQEGDKPVDLEGIIGHGRVPKRIIVTWNGPMNRTHQVTIRGSRKCPVLQITLNKDCPRISEFKDDPSKLATMCCGHIAYELTHNDKDKDLYQKMFPSFIYEDYHDTYNALIARISSEQPQVK